jgi:hypothetical protein
MAGVHCTRSARITFRDCEVNALPCMGFVSQFTDTDWLITLADPVPAFVENNTFERCRTYGVLVEGGARKWFESSPIRDLEIRGNRFIDCGVGITSTVSDPKPEEPVHENIRILDNQFESGGISASVVKGLVVRNNQAVPAPLKVDLAPSCTEVTVENNR